MQKIILFTLQIVEIYFFSLTSIAGKKATLQPSITGGLYG